MSDYSSFPDLEVLDLRKKVRELEVKLTEYEHTLRSNNLLDVVKAPSVEELICIREIQKLDELSKRQGLQLEDTKIFDTLVKALHLIRSGALPKEEKKGKKKEEKVDVAKLLHIAGRKD